MSYKLKSIKGYDVVFINGKIESITPSEGTIVKEYNSAHPLNGCSDGYGHRSNTLYEVRRKYERGYSIKLRFKGWRMPYLEYIQEEVDTWIKEWYENDIALQAMKQFKIHTFMSKKGYAHISIKYVSGPEWSRVFKEFLMPLVVALNRMEEEECDSMDAFMGHYGYALAESRAKWLTPLMPSDEYDPNDDLPF